MLEDGSSEQVTFQCLKKNVKPRCDTVNCLLTSLLTSCEVGLYWASVKSAWNFFATSARKTIFSTFCVCGKHMDEETLEILQ